MYEFKEKRVRPAADMKKSFDRKARRAEAKANYDNSLRVASRMMRKGEIVAPKRKVTRVITSKKHKVTPVYDLDY